MIIRAARVGDTEQIVRIMRNGFSEQIVAATIYGTRGIGAFIDAQLEAPAGLSDTAYVVAEAEGQIAGCVELRRLPDTLFLSYIAVRADTRSSGLARLLLRDAILAVRDEGQSQMLLDVFADNTPARRWYERLGFNKLYGTQWWSLPLLRAELAPPSPVAGYPQAGVAQASFDFSQFVVRTQAGEYTVGRIGSEWFRLTQPEALQDVRLMSTLTRLDGQRRILGVFRQGAAEEDCFEAGVRLVTSYRMGMDLEHLVKHLHIQNSG